MEIKTYDDEDLQDYVTAEDDVPRYSYQFIADLPGDNPDLFSTMDNHDMCERLVARGVITPQMTADEESCCFYIYFTCREDGRKFISALNSYLLKKAEKLQDALEY